MNRIYEAVLRWINEPSTDNDKFSPRLIFSIFLWMTSLVMAVAIASVIAYSHEPIGYVWMSVALTFLACVFLARCAIAFEVAYQLYKPKSRSS